MTGLAVAVVEDGKLAFVCGYGVTSQKTLQPMTEHTVFRCASLSKGVAATMAAKLAADGRLDLDRTIASYGTSLRLPGHAEQQRSEEHTSELQSLMRISYAVSR